MSAASPTRRVSTLVLGVCLVVVAVVSACGSSPREQGAEEIERYDGTAWQAPPFLDDHFGSTGHWSSRRTPPGDFTELKARPVVPTTHNATYAIGGPDIEEDARELQEELVTFLESIGAEVTGCSPDRQSVFLAATEGSDLLHLRVSVLERGRETLVTYMLAINGDAAEWPPRGDVVAGGCDR